MINQFALTARSSLRSRLQRVIDDHRSRGLAAVPAGPCQRRRWGRHDRLLPQCADDRCPGPRAASAPGSLFFDNL